jgi:hypothetical protein
MARPFQLLDPRTLPCRVKSAPLSLWPAMHQATCRAAPWAPTRLPKATETRSTHWRTLASARAHTLTLFAPSERLPVLDRCARLRPLVNRLCARPTPVHTPTASAMAARWQQVQHTEPVPALVQCADAAPGSECTTRSNGFQHHASKQHSFLSPFLLASAPCNRPHTPA